ncbi:MAG: hypothetical protein M3N95_14495 [Actinomycetota bacterium]|nr:hypothetical protein [Actinomycetota bacterium]
MALKFLDLDGRGLEIGPSYSPLVPKASGARVETVDHADHATLTAKYEAWGVPKEKIGAIEPVDHIWAGGSLVDLIPERESYDYIVASHFLEHTVDAVAFLTDCEALLADGGRLALVLPDKRYCFDRFQPLSTVGDMVDALYGRNSFHTAGTLLDHQAYSCRRGEYTAWDSARTTDLSLQFPKLEHALEVIGAGLAQDSYHDIHHWKFTPTSFELLMRDLATLNLQHFGPVGSFGTSGFEFFVTLGKGLPWPEADRLALLERIEDELAEPLVTNLANLSLRRQLAEIRSQLAAIRASKSWRATAPAAHARAALRRLRPQRIRS